MNYLNKLKNFVFDDNGSEREDNYEGDGLYGGEDDNSSTRTFNEEPITAKKTPEDSGAATVNMSSNTNINMRMFHPDGLELLYKISDCLLAGETVVLNLESAKKEDSRRLIDFVSGVAYAVHGNIKKAANCTYVVVPSNVAVYGTESEQQEGTETF